MAKYLLPILLDDNTIINSGKSHMRLKISPPIELDKKSQYIVNFSGTIPRTVFNVTDSLNNNKFRYSVDAGVSWTEVTLVNGSYGPGGLIAAIRYYLIQNGHYTAGDTFFQNTYAWSLSFSDVTGKAFIEIEDKDNTVVDFTNDGTSTFYQLLGFFQEDRHELSGSNIIFGNLDADLNGDQGLFSINLNIVSNIDYRGTVNNTLYTTSWQGPPHTLHRIPYSVVEKQPVPLNTTRIETIEIRFLDRAGNLLTFHGENSKDNHPRIMLHIEKV